MCKRWLTRNFLSAALWVIFDGEGNIGVAMHRVHYGPLHVLALMLYLADCVGQNDFSI